MRAARPPKAQGEGKSPRWKQDGTEHQGLRLHRPLESLGVQRQPVRTPRLALPRPEEASRVFLLSTAPSGNMPQQAPHPAHTPPTARLSAERAGVVPRRGNHRQQLAPSAPGGRPRGRERLKHSPGTVSADRRSHRPTTLRGHKPSIDSAKLTHADDPIAQGTSPCSPTIEVTMGVIACGPIRCPSGVTCSNGEMETRLLFIHEGTQAYFRTNFGDLGSGAGEAAWCCPSGTT